MLPMAIQAGMTIPQFWTSTIGEIVLYLKAYTEREEARSKELLTSNYNIAYLTACFVGYTFDGKPIPSIQQLFPTVFTEENVEKEQEEKALALYKEQMLDFAIAHNKKRTQRKVTNN